MEKKVDSYLNDRSTELSSLVHKFPAQKKIYMYTYILLIVFYFVQIKIFFLFALPSPATSKRVFSIAGLIFTAKRTRLSNLNYEILVLKIKWWMLPGRIDNPIKASKT